MPPTTPSLHAQFAGFINKGLVGVGRVAAASFDRAGDGQQDTLGGLFSSMHFDVESLRIRKGESGATIYEGVLYSLPDRGYGDGARDYRPRIQTFSIRIEPYVSETPTLRQDQITLSNTSTLLLRSPGGYYTGSDAADARETRFPKAADQGSAQGHPSMDPEGLVRMKDGSFYVSEEYGPFIYHFDAKGQWIETLRPPEAFLPKNGPYPGINTFTATNAPQSGRRNNRGFEGLTLSPDQRRLTAMTQSPLDQDSGLKNDSRNTRVLQFDLRAPAGSAKRIAAEYVYQLTLNGSETGPWHTPVNEVLSITPETFLALERDSYGLGSFTNSAPRFKKIVLFNTRNATDIAGSGYDLPAGAPNQRSLPLHTLPKEIRPVERLDFVDLLNPQDLARFGLNVSTNHNANTISEKWEGMTVVPMNDAKFPDDYLLLVGNDNDFKAPVVYHGGVAVATNHTTVDNMLLAFRVTLPGYARARGRSFR